MEMKEMDRVWFCSSLSSPRWLSLYHWDVTSGISGAAVDESEPGHGQPQAVPSCAELCRAELCQLRMRSSSGPRWAQPGFKGAGMVILQWKIWVQSCAAPHLMAEPYRTGACELLGRMGVPGDPWFFGSRVAETQGWKTCRASAAVSLQACARGEAKKRRSLSEPERMG